MDITWPTFSLKHVLCLEMRTCSNNLKMELRITESQWRNTQKIIEEVKEQVKEDLNSFSTRFRLANFHSYNTINIKQLVYRSTTIFIAALSNLRNISSNSCFDVINKMAKNSQITQNMAHYLSFAIAIACEMRLRVYMKKKSQCDNAIDLKKDGICTFLDIVGVRYTMYYQLFSNCVLFAM